MSIELLLAGIAEALKENTEAVRECTLTMQELIAAITETKKRFGAKADAALTPTHATVDVPASAEAAPAATTEPKRRKKPEAAAIPAEQPVVTPLAEVETPKSVAQTQTDAPTQTTAAAEITASDAQLPKVNNSEATAESTLTKEARIALAKEAVMMSNNDANVVRELLKPFGVTKISELTESKASAFDTSLRALVAKLKAKEDDGIY